VCGRQTIFEGTAAKQAKARVASKMNDETQSLLSAGFDHCRSLWIDGCFCFDHSPTILANRMVMVAGDDHFSLREPHTAAGTGDCVGKATRNQEFQGATQIRERRRTLRYRRLLVRQAVQLKNKIAQMLMEEGVSYNKQRLHKVGNYPLVTQATFRGSRNVEARGDDPSSGRQDEHQHDQSRQRKARYKRERPVQRVRMEVTIPVRPEMHQRPHGKPPC
jgi:hypothetical protein